MNGMARPSNDGVHLETPQAQTETRSTIVETLAVTPRLHKNVPGACVMMFWTHVCGCDVMQLPSDDWPCHEYTPYTRLQVITVPRLSISIERRNPSVAGAHCGAHVVRLGS